MEEMDVFKINGVDEDDKWHFTHPFHYHSLKSLKYRATTNTEQTMNDSLVATWRIIIIIIIIKYLHAFQNGPKSMASSTNNSYYWKLSNSRKLEFLIIIRLII